MEKLHNEPDVKRQDFSAFVNELRLFHQSKGTPFRQLPRINGREIDLQKFYNLVTSLGGLQKVVESQKWNIVAEALNLPKSCANFALGLRQIYIRYLGHYEKIHFMGEDLDSDKNQSSESHGRKVQFNLFQQVPMVYNMLQHEIPNSTRSATGLNQIFTTPTDYDKICLSLLSGLPNEQELALNVCTILSNEGNYMLHLEQAPKLVDLLLAQIGIWPKEDNSLKLLFLESWRDLKGRNMYKFWRSTLDLQNTDIIQLLGLDLGNFDPVEQLFNLENDLGALNIEGQRVLRVALILHNLSFEKNNVPVLVDNPSFIRFVLLCVHSSWTNLKQIAYDILSNLAYKMKLSVEKDICSRIMFQTVIDGIRSPDRYMNIRSMDILSQLCSCEANEDIVTSGLAIEAYQQMVSFLTVHDIMLLFYALEALYALSDLGRYTCDKIVCVHRCIGVLVSLLTLEPNHYGPSGHINMKVVETLVPIEYDFEHEAKPVTTASNDDSIPPSSTTIRPANNDVDSETFANNWLKTTYEILSAGSISRNEIYAEYVSFCSKSGRKGVVNANVFASCVKKTFPSCGLKKVESGNGIITFHHAGIQKKVYTTQTGPPFTKCSTSVNSVQKVPVPCSPISSRSSQKQSLSPILKAQLSAPPRSGVSSPPPKHLPQSILNGRKCVSSSPVTIQTPPFAATVPITSGSSTLIKSLLANKVQQRNMHRQVLPHNVSKMVIYSPEKVTSLNRGVIGSSTTMVRCVRPGAFSGIRTPIQTRIFSNKARILTAGSPKIFKASPIFASKIQPKYFKKPMLALPATRINGVQKDLMVEVCNQDEEHKSSLEAVHVQTNQINCIQNHFTMESYVERDLKSLDCESLLSSKESDLNIKTHQTLKSSIDCRLDNTSDVHTVNKSISTSKISTFQVNSKENHGSSFTCVDSNSFMSDPSSSSQTETHPPKNLPASSSAEPVLSDLTDMSKPLQNDKISKRAPLLNGLLDKGKVPSSEMLLSNIFVQNGNKCSAEREIKSKDNETVIQPTFNTSVNNISSSQKKTVFLQSKLVNSVDTPLSSVSVNTSSVSATHVSTKNSHISSSVINTAVPANAFHSNNEDLMQICTSQTTLSGTIEVQPDQKGVVRLHIESPENSNQGSDLSSISDIARTLECASKAISRTNEECNKHVPYCGACETTATVTVITTNTSTLAHTGQQIIVVTPAVNQPQLHVQSPNVKFRILHSVSKVEQSVDLVDPPKVNSDLSEQTSKTPSIPTATFKRPSSDASDMFVPSEPKKPCVDSKTPLLEASLKLPTSVPSVTVNTSENAKSFPENSSFLLKSSIDNLVSTPRLTTAKAVAVPVQNIDIPNEREKKTFSGLLSASDNPSLSAPSQIPPHSTSTKLEYVCEWKDCGLKFPNSGSVFLHATNVHASLCNDDVICLWNGCDSNMKRKHFSLITHLQDWHCNERVLHAQAVRRTQLSQQGKSAIAPLQTPPVHPGYAPEAALLAIRRHALQYINPKELTEEKESALTKSIRLTSALILRNLVTHSALARTYLKRFESELAYIAMSPVESARTIAQCLSLLSRAHD